MAKKNGILKKDFETGKIFLREGVIVAFFLPTPMDKVAEPILDVFEEYLKMIPSDVLRWASIGASSEEWKPINKTTFQRCRAQLKPEAVAKRRLTAFELADGDMAGDAPRYGIIVIGHPYEPRFPNKKTLVQMYFPIDVVSEQEVEHFVENVCKLAVSLPYISGYASPALLCAGFNSFSVGKEIRAITRIHPGYDVQDNPVGRRTINSKVRGARWLNFIGPEIADRLGGVKALRKALRSPITIDEEIGHGVMIRAGKQPELGNMTRRIGTPLLRAIASVLEPVTAFRESALYRTDFADQNEELLEQWERRFLD